MREKSEGRKRDIQKSKIERRENVRRRRGF
jgi:hypothetical protein